MTNERKPAENTLRDIVLMGALLGDSRVGFLTNPDAKNRSSYITVNGEKVVCEAKGGECRFNDKYFSPGLDDTKSWTTPVIDATCPNECPYKMLVHDNHPKKGCAESRRPYPQCNKFGGEFFSYCRELSRLERGKQRKS